MGMGRGGDAETWRHGDAETQRRGEKVDITFPIPKQQTTNNQ